MEVVDCRSGGNLLMDHVELFLHFSVRDEAILIVVEFINKGFDFRIGERLDIRIRIREERRGYDGLHCAGCCHPCMGPRYGAIT